MYVYVYTYMYQYMYTQIYMYIQLCKHTHIYIYVYIHIHIYIHLYTCMYKCVCIFLSVCGVFKCTLYVSVNTSVGAHACVHVHDLSTHTRTLYCVVLEQKS